MLFAQAILHAWVASALGRQRGGSVHIHVERRRCLWMDEAVGVQSERAEALVLVRRGAAVAATHKPLPACPKEARSRV